MDPATKARLLEEGGKIVGSFLRVTMTHSRKPSTATKEAPVKSSEPVETTALATTPPRIKPQSAKAISLATLPEEKATAEIATGCLPCALGHFSTSSGLLNEAVRFKGEGITSNKVLDAIAGALEQQNALEREDLSPVKIQGLSEWQKPIAEEALDQSQKLRHRLEAILSVDELVQAAADTKRYYIKLNRQWYKGRFRHLGAKKAEAIAQRVGEE